MTPVADLLAALLVKATARPWHAADRGIGWEVHHGTRDADGKCWSGKATCREINDGFRETMGEHDARLIVALANVADEIVLILRAYEASRTDRGSMPVYEVYEHVRALAARLGLLLEEHNG